jgi:pilus assembly protein CpaB
MNKAALIVALGSALVGLGMLWLYMQRFEAEASGGAPVAVLMATQDIPLGSTLTQEMLGIRSLPASYVEERHIRAADADRIIGVRVSMGVKANESLLWTDLATTSQQRRDLSGLVRNGMRAVTIRADTTSAFGGLLRPGDRVDLLITTSRDGTAEGNRVTVPLLQNVIVLAVGRDTGMEEVDGRRRTTERRFNEVTLSVTVEQSQILTLADSSGTITLTLRNPDDIAILDGLPETTRSDILEPQRRARLLRRERSDEEQTTVVPEQIQ